MTGAPLFSNGYGATEEDSEEFFDPADASTVETIKELLARDPLREEAHALLMTIHGLIGTRSQVVRQYRRLRSVLERELDVTPLPESEATYQLALVRTQERSQARAALIRTASRPRLVSIHA